MGMQPSVHPSKVAQPSIRRKNKKNANAQPQDNANMGDPPISADGSSGGVGPPPPPPPPSNGGNGGPLPAPERENSESLPSPPILNTNLSQDFDIYESEDYPIGQASYDYDSQGAEDILSMTEGEQFNILEGDNEGWTLVQRMNSGEEGFVPTSFLLIS